MFFSFISPKAKKGGKGMMIFGGILFLFGILIYANPEILVFLISSFFIFIGLITFSLGLSSYQLGKRMNQSNKFIDYDDLFKR